ncbi:hypothetical protein KY289_028659 [Solanum tuberosum]|nr:hypothetical protein KY289_028659 [Solanum tuberosum]
MGQKGYQSPAKKVLSWIRKKSKKVKIFLGLITAIVLLVTLKLVVHDHNLFFVIAEAIHLIGLLMFLFSTFRWDMLNFGIWDILVGSWEN